MSLDLEDLNSAFQVQERRIELIENRMDKLEGTACSSPCQDVKSLRVEIDSWKHDLSSCSTSKDEKINGLSTEVHMMKGSLDKLDKDMGVLTMAVKDIGNSLSEIAKNTGDIKEVVDVYKNLKGAGWVAKNFGAIILTIAGVLGAWWVIANTTINVPK